MKKIKSWEDVDKALLELSELNYQTDRLQSEKTMKVNTIEVAFNKEYGPIAEKAGTIRRNILEFCTKHAKTFENQKTKELPNGKIQLRTSTKVDIANEEKAIEIAKNLGLSWCITTKECLDKNILKKLEASQQKKLGVKVFKEENYTIKPNESKLKSVAEA